MALTSSFHNDFVFSQQSLSAWVNKLKSIFGPDLYEVQLREDKELQKKGYLDALLVFVKRDPIRIEIKSRRIDYYRFYLQDRKRVIETKGNVERDDLGSAIFNSNVKLWATGFFNGFHIMSPLVFKRQPVAEKLKELMTHQPQKYREIQNKPTDGLYHSAFVLLEERYIIPHSINSFQGLQELN